MYQYKPTGGLSQILPSDWLQLLTDYWRQTTSSEKNRFNGRKLTFSSSVVYTRKNACSVTAFNSTDIRPIQDNVATPVTAMMVTVCISTDALSSVLISPDLSDTNSVHHCCWSFMPFTACSCKLQQSVPNILLHQTDTVLTTQQTV